jgi:hypothetical protein
MIQPGTVWKDTETGEIVTVESYDGAYAVVFGEHPATGRGISFEGKPNAFLVQKTHFGTLYVPEEK